MEIKDWEILIAHSQEGMWSFVTLADKTSVIRAYTQVRRALNFGYELCFTRLYGDKFYFEKIKDGNTSLYLNRRKKK